MDKDILEPLRVLAHSIGVLSELDALVSAIESNKLEEIDRALDSLIPSAAGAHTTFLPNFAMTATAKFMRGRTSWKSLRDRVFANLEEMERAAKNVREQVKRDEIVRMLNEQRLAYEPYRAEHDPVIPNGSAKPS